MWAQSSVSGFSWSFQYWQICSLELNRVHRSSAATFRNDGILSLALCLCYACPLLKTSSNCSFASHIQLSSSLRDQLSIDSWICFCMAIHPPLFFGLCLAESAESVSHLSTLRLGNTSQICTLEENSWIATTCHDYQMDCECRNCQHHTGVLSKRNQKLRSLSNSEGTYAKCIFQLDSPVLWVTLEFAAMSETAHYAKHIQASGMTKPSLPLQ